MATGLKLIQTTVGWWNKLDKNMTVSTPNSARAKQLRNAKRVAGKILRAKMKEDLRNEYGV